MGVSLKNETVYEDMIDIMENLHKYVPAVSEEKFLDVPEVTAEPVTLRTVHFHKILFGGDQLTVARARGSQDIRDNSDSAEHSLQGLVPVIEDWHAKGVFLSVS